MLQFHNDFKSSLYEVAKSLFINSVLVMVMHGFSLYLCKLFQFSLTMFPPVGVTVRGQINSVILFFSFQLKYLSVFLNYKLGKNMIGK